MGGHELKDISLTQLYDQVAFVSQDNYLFDDTVRENVRMGRRNASDAEVEAAAQAAGCGSFIRSLENGFDTLVGGSGLHLSGGERQRIAIARAMLKDAPIVVLDEATAYIDPENEAVVQRAVVRLVENRMVVVIAHRLSTITGADNIAVVQNGTIAAQEAALQIAGVGMMLAAIALRLGGGMTLPDALMVLVMSFLVFSQIRLFGMGVSMLRMAAAAIDRTVETEQMPQMDENGKTVTPQTHDIVFDHVDFSYEKRPILRDVSVTLPDKTTTAIVGPSGSGKTTLCNLAARFWDVDGGSVRIGGTDVRDNTLESLMRQISMVFQNVYLFADTIENNTNFGCPDATHAQVVAAAEKACCADFIARLPDGYDTIVGEGGASLSGGERQRLCIARAMLKDAPIVILDEATANVDPENEDRLQTAIEALTHEKTVVMIAHRLKTVRSADQILVLSGGRIVQKGTHAKLAAQDGIYRDFITERQQAADWKL